MTKEDIFYYVYGVLHARSTARDSLADLKKMLPRIPADEGDGRILRRSARPAASWRSGI